MPYAQGWPLCRVLSTGTVKHEYDKYVSRTRKVLYMVDFKDILTKFFSQRLNGLRLDLYSTIYNKKLTPKSKAVMSELGIVTTMLADNPKKILQKNLLENLTKIAVIDNGSKHLNSVVDIFFQTHDCFICNYSPKSFYDLLTYICDVSCEINKTSYDCDEQLSIIENELLEIEKDVKRIDPRNMKKKVSKKK